MTQEHTDFPWVTINNGRLRSAEILLKEDGSTQLIRRAETPDDYFATFDCFDILKNMKHPEK